MWITVRVEVRKEIGHTKDGMSMDFTDLKSIVKPYIIDKYDYSLVLNSPHADLDFSAFDKVFFLNYQPNSENLVTDFVRCIKENLTKGVDLLKVILSKNLLHIQKGI